MGITNSQAGTRIDEIAAGIYRISTPVASVPGGFTFNQFLIADDEPLLFHTGPRRMAPLVCEAIASVVPLAKLRWIGFSHHEADESGGMNELLARAPAASPVCGAVAAMVQMTDLADRPPRALADGEVLVLGTHRVTWFDAPHIPHGWDCGYLLEATTRTLLCGDLFTQGGADHAPLTDRDILGPSEAFRGMMDYYSHTTRARGPLERLAATEPTTLACMHGSSWQGDGAQLLRGLAAALATDRAG